MIMSCNTSIQRHAYNNNSNTSPLKTRHGKAKQGKARQDKTKQGKAREDKSRWNIHILVAYNDNHNDNNNVNDNDNDNHYSMNSDDLKIIS